MSVLYLWTAWNKRSAQVKMSLAKGHKGDPPFGNDGRKLVERNDSIYHNPGERNSLTGWKKELTETFKLKRDVSLPGSD